MGVLKNQPVLRRMDNSPFFLVRLLVGAEIDRRPHILRPGKNLSNRETVPVAGTGDVLFAFPYTPALSGEIDGRRLDLLLTEHRGNLIGAVALNGKLEDTPYHRCRFLIN